jgi:hypothetical protein
MCSIYEATGATSGHLSQIRNSSVHHVEKSRLTSKWQATTMCNMDVQRVKDFTKPSYPDRKEFLRNRNLLGAVLLGTGLVTSACNKTETVHRTQGIVAQPARRLSGVILESPQPAKEAPPQPGDKPSR